MASTGQKVTTDSRSKDAIPESVGIVTSDSLAAESMQSAGSGHFGSGNYKAGVSKQPSSSSNAATTDTSSATKLNPAVDAEAREAQEGWSESAQLSAGAGLGKHSTSGGPTESSNTASTGGVPEAPTGSYASNVHVPEGNLKPKGKNITEGGFDSGAPNASFGTDIGGRKDPGRVAEATFQRSNAQAGGDAGGGPRQSGLDGGSVYAELKRDENV